MRDINTPLQKTYYDALNGNVVNNAVQVVKVYEDQEPDGEDAEQYIVITGRNSNDTSTKSSSDVSAEIQITVNTRRRKYNNRKELNYICDQILQIIKPTPNAVLDMESFNIQMMNLSLQSDTELDYGTLAEQAFVSRNLIFQQDLFIKE